VETQRPGLAAKQASKSQVIKKGQWWNVIYKRGRVYWYKFSWNGTAIRESTRQKNDRVARQMEAAHRTALAKGQVGIREPRPFPTFAEFCTNRVEPWARARFEKTCPKNWLWYRTGIRALSNFKPLARTSIDKINSELASDFAAHRLRGGMQVSTANNSLRVLRRVLNLAVEWGIITAAPRIKVLSGERHRERVISADEEARYLVAATEPLASVVAILADTGMRPEECFRLQWENITWLNGRNGALLVTRGKTAAARRLIPMTQRVRDILHSRWNTSGNPQEGWIWPALTRSGHMEPSTIRKQHAAVFRALSKKAVEKNEKPMRPFVLYSLRHTFLTRLGQSGCDVWTLARIAGHASISISSRYVHPSEDAVLNAISRLGGHNIGHKEIRLFSCPLPKTTQAQYIELVANDAPVAQLDRASAF
jgi:integrase